jgi:hypothetical protein
MTTTQIILVAAVVVAIVIALLAGQRGGPRVTQIDRTIERDKEGE